MAEEVQSGSDSSSSVCLFLDTDASGGQVKTVVFNRDEKEDGDTDAAAAHLLGIDGERMRCFYVPHMEKKLGYALHMYIDLSGVEHKKEHNTNAAQLWLAANLPNEPPEVTPSTVSGPALITAECIPSEEYKDLTLQDWEIIKSECKNICPNAIFL